MRPRPSVRASLGRWDGVRWVKARIALLTLALALGLLLVLGRAYDLQVRKRDWLGGLADGQHQRTWELAPHRGAILDRRGGSLASSVEVESIFVDPALLGPDAAARREAVERLGAVAGLSRKQIEGVLARVEREGSRFAWLQRKVGPAVAAEVRGLGLPGVGFVKEAKRFYPERELAAQILGFVGNDGKGLEGLERVHDEALRGHGATVSALRDARGRALLAEASVSALSRTGATLTLTLDRAIQYAAEKALAQGVRESGAASGTAVVLDPDTGEILALAVLPTFNPNVVPAGERRQGVRNRAVTDTFEPGSTMKVFLLAGAVEAGLVQEGQRFDCENGRWRVGRHTIHDTSRHATLTPAEILKFSSNVCSGKIGLLLGAERLAATYRAFGFGERPGTGLPAEAAGVVGAIPREISLVTAAFGQGPITASALQIASATAAIANGGKLMRPWILRSLVSPEGVVLEEGRPEVVRQVVSPETAARITAWMEGVVGPKGTGRAAALEGHRVAGKTGTSQKVDPATGRYGKARVASFAGFAPAEDPRLVIVVVLDEPEEGAGGGRVAAPVFAAIAEDALALLAVPPSVGKPELLAAAEEVPVEAEAPWLDLEEEEGAPPPEDGALVRVPDLRGLAARPAIQRLGALGLEAGMEGSGRVKTQRPAPGSHVHPGSRVSLVLDSS